MPTTFTPEIIAAAIEGFELQKRRIDGQIAELRAMLPGGSAGSDAATESPGRKRRKFSAAARKRMRDGQRLRWAKIRGESEAATPEPAKPKLKLTAAARAKLVANLRKARAAKAAKAKAAAKKAAPARKKTTARKAAVKTAPVKAVKKTAPVKKAAAKKTPPAPAPSVSETVALQP